jgi:hypothetical protein
MAAEEVSETEFQERFRERFLRNMQILYAISGRESSAGTCNYCTLKSIVRFAETTGREVFVVPIDQRHDFYPRWPETVEVYTCAIGGHDYAWSATMLALPERCAC